ncbi:MAG: rRNA pseudouridine synthase [Betaproteobacteria bacterium]|nr:rRNA pseudouridine synthase [Betaproteobacteria bacterium]
MEPVRISKLMSEQGICSRREADSYIERGWVFLDGEQVTELGTRAYPNQRITLSKAAKTTQQARVTVLLNKPIGYVSGQAEHQHKPAYTLIEAASRHAGDRSPQRFSPLHLKGLAAAGRLDIDSTGLLVLTQDGRIAKQLIGQDTEIEKEYLVRVSGTLPDSGLALLNFGLSLDGSPLRRAQVSWLNPDQLRFILQEGKKRQIRRMCELVGLKVLGLKRVRIGKVKLGDLPTGKWRYLRDDEEF